MTYACPYCASCATRSDELLDHLKARRLWGGHEIARDKATRIVERISRTTRVKKQLARQPERARR